MLQHRDVRLVSFIESEPLRECLQQPGVGGLRVLDHRDVGLQRNVDGYHWTLLRGRRLSETA